MDSFEHVIAAVLERRGYWTRISVKVELTQDEKRAIGRHSSPRWELDVVGYSGEKHELLVLECKSQLVEAGFCKPAPKIKLGLAAGNWTPELIREDLRQLADSKYENSIASVVAKLLLRGSVDPAQGTSKSAKAASTKKRELSRKSAD